MRWHAMRKVAAVAVSLLLALLGMPLAALGKPAVAEGPGDSEAKLVKLMLYDPEAEGEGANVYRCDLEEYLEALFSDDETKPDNAEAPLELPAVEDPSLLQAVAEALGEDEAPTVLDVSWKGYREIEVEVAEQAAHLLDAESPKPDAWEFSVQEAVACPTEAEVQVEVTAAALDCTYLSADGTQGVVEVELDGLEGRKAAYAVELDNAQRRTAEEQALQQGLVPLDVPPLDAQPYRLEADQLEAVKGALNAAMDAQVDPGNLVGPDGSGFSVLDQGSFSFRGYGALPGADTTVTVTFALDGRLAGAYALTSTEATFVVQALAAYDLPEGFRLTGGASGSTWVNHDVEASYDGHGLSWALDGPYEASLALNSAEGAYAGQTLYARDSTGALSQVTGIAYNIDKTAPSVRSFSVGRPYRVLDGLFLYRDAADVTIALDDQAAASGPSGALPMVSGIAADGAVLSYEDSRSGQARQALGAPVGDLGPSGLLRFSIDGDQDTRTETFRLAARDNAGNLLEADTADALQIPADVLELVSDSAPPVVSVEFDNDDVRHGRFFNAERTATISVTEAHFDLLQRYDPKQVVATVTENGYARTFSVAAFKPVGHDTWQVSYAFSNDSDYRLEAQVTDLVGKASARYATDFTIDRRAPSVSVEFDNDSSRGGYYSAGRTATVTVYEHNFDEDLVTIAPASGAGNGATVATAASSAWSHDGDAHWAHVTFPGPGAYGLTVGGTDSADNAMAAYECPEFVIDLESPTISVVVGGDVDAARHAYAGECAVQVTISDTNVDPSSTVSIEALSWNAAPSPYFAAPSLSATEVSASYPDPPRVPESDGVYRLTVSAQDLAGNAATKVVDWSVNRFGSTYVLSTDTQAMVDQRFLRPEKLHDVVVTEINPSGIDEADVLVSLTSGTRNRTLERDQDFGFAPVANDWPAYSYAVPKEAFAADGAYQLALHSTDAAANGNMNTLAWTNHDRTNAADVLFSVDSTAPLVSFSGFDEPEVAGDSHAVGVSIEDNLVLDHARVLSNGELVAEWGPEELATQEHEVVLGESSANQVLTVEAYDAAGNMVPQMSRPIFVNSNPFVRWAHNPVLVLATVAAVAAMAAGVVLWRRKKQLEKLRARRR